MYQSFISSTMSVIELVTSQKLQEYINIENLVPAAQGTFHFGIFSDLVFLLLTSSLSC
jgi:hypothetical protein